MSRTLLFHRDFHRYTCGHGKVWDYFRRVRAYPDWNAVNNFSRGADAQKNLWWHVSNQLLLERHPQETKALFLTVMDWQMQPQGEMAQMLAESRKLSATAPVGTNP